MSRPKGVKDKNPRPKRRKEHYRGIYDIAIYNEEDELEDIVPNGYALAEWLGVGERWLRRGCLTCAFTGRSKSVRDSKGNRHYLAFIDQSDDTSELFKQEKCSTKGETL